MTPSRGAPSVTLRPSRPWQAFYLYPGVDCRADFQECFVALIQAWNASSDFEFIVDLVWYEIDVLNTDATTPLLSSVNRAKLLAKISTRCDICYLHSRLRHFFARSSFEPRWPTSCAQCFLAPWFTSAYWCS